MIAALLILFFLGILGWWWYVQDKKRYSKFPPGLTRLPYIGNLLQMSSSDFPSIIFSKLAKKHGDVFHVKMGMIDAVAFNSFETVHEILAADGASGRNHELLGSIRERNLNRNLGLLFANGHEWQSLRRFTIRTLREFGFGKSSSMDVVVNEEMQKFMVYLNSQIEQSPNGCVQSETLFELTLVNVFWRLVTGVNYEMDDPKMLHLLRASDKMLRSTNFAFDITIAFPFLWDMFPNWSGKNSQIEVAHELREFARDSLKEHRAAGGYSGNSQCYVDAFLAKIDENKNDPNSEYTDDQLVLCLLDLFQAGSETSTKTLAFTLLYMLNNPHVQEKIQKEIDQEIPENESITTASRSKLPYTHAALLESLRWSIVTPFPPPRMASDDINYKGHVIPKGTTLLVNMQAAHFSESKWGDPFNFRPERFLTKEGTVDSKIANALVSFGAGKRVCLGQSLAETSMFIYFATLLRTFNLFKAPGEEPSIVPKPGMTNSPQPFKVKFVSRK